MLKDKIYYKYFIFPTLLLLFLSLIFYSGYLFSESYKKQPESVEPSEEVITGQVYVAFRFENTTYFLINYTDHKLFFSFEFTNELFDNLEDFHITNTNNSVFAYFLFTNTTKQVKINVSFIDYAKQGIENGHLTLLASTYHDECYYSCEHISCFIAGFENKLLELPSDFALKNGFPEEYPYTLLILTGTIKGV
jgi:hypothetical protein